MPISDCIKHLNVDTNSNNLKEGFRKVDSIFVLPGCSEVASGTFRGNQGNWHRLGRSELSHHLVKIDPEKEAARNGEI